jgi:hypothetical protein
MRTEKKMKKAAILVTISIGLMQSVLAAPLEWWDMNDPAGTSLLGLNNTGTIDSIWNFNHTGAATDGNGLFVVAGNVGNITRKLPKKGSATAEITGVNDIYAAPVTTGAYSLTVDFASWTFDSASEGDLWKLKVTDSSGIEIAGIELGIVSGAGRIRMWTQGVSNQYYRSFAFNTTEAAGALAEVRFDLDNDTVSYYIDGNQEYLFSDFAGANIGGMIYNTAGDGTADWATAASNIKINAMGIDVIPEPATIGMLGVGAAVILYFRRKKLVR